jgi:hypothetical protein
MDEIDLAMRTRRAKNRKEALAKLDPSASVPSELLGLTAVASEAGMINPALAGKDIKRAVKALDNFDIVETSVTMKQKEGDGRPIKFRYGRNNTPQIEASARGVENASRTAMPVKRAQVQKPLPKEPRPIHAHRGRARRPDSATPSDLEREFDGHRGYSSDSELTPPVRPKSALRAVSSVGRTSPPATTEPATKTESSAEDTVSSSLEHHPPTSQDLIDGENSAIFRTPTMPSEFELQTKSNTELAAQLIARALRVDFVYFMRLSPITATSLNGASDPASEINMEILGCYGLPFPELNFKLDLHLAALRSESGITYDNTAEFDSKDDGIVNNKDYFRIGIVVPVWRDYPTPSRTGTVTGSVTSSTKAQVGTASEADCRPGSSSSVGGGVRQSVGASSVTTNTTVRRLRESCRSGVVVGVFTKRLDRNTFTTIEKEYLMEWVSLKDHL